MARAIHEATQKNLAKRNEKRRTDPDTPHARAIVLISESALCAFMSAMRSL